jgi:3-isopropylmalate/(R)-2-methylmalate dehydratase small subunit
VTLWSFDLPQDFLDNGAKTFGKGEAMKVIGRVWRFGDDVDTDAIIPARYLNTTDPQELARHCMEDADAQFAQRVRPGDIIVAGKNFGCGSSREHAPLCIKAAGVSCVIAAGFARIFYRNAFNIGLPILESPEAAAVCMQGDELEVDLATGEIRDLTQKKSFTAQPIPPFMQELIKDGGLIRHVAKRLAEGA